MSERLTQDDAVAQVAMALRAAGIVEPVQYSDDVGDAETVAALAVRALWPFIDQHPGCWIASYADWSGFAVFGTELAALRHCVEHSMDGVRFVEWGEFTR